MRNRYAARCTTCTLTVGVGDGWAERGPTGRWQVTCDDCLIAEVDREVATRLATPTAPAPRVYAQVTLINGERAWVWPESTDGTWWLDSTCCEPGWTIQVGDRWVTGMDVDEESIIDDDEDHTVLGYTRLYQVRDATDAERDAVMAEHAADDAHDAQVAARGAMVADTATQAAEDWYRTLLSGADPETAWRERLGGHETVDVTDLCAPEDRHQELWIEAADRPDRRIWSTGWWSDTCDMALTWLPWTPEAQAHVDRLVSWRKRPLPEVGTVPAAA